MDGETLATAAAHEVDAYFRVLARAELVYYMGLSQQTQNALVNANMRQLALADDERALEALRLATREYLRANRRSLAWREANMPYAITFFDGYEIRVHTFPAKAGENGGVVWHEQLLFVPQGTR